MFCRGLTPPAPLRNKPCAALVKGREQSARRGLGSDGAAGREGVSGGALFPILYPILCPIPV